MGKEGLQAASHLKDARQQAKVHQQCERQAGHTGTVAQLGGGVFHDGDEYEVIDVEHIPARSGQQAQPGRGGTIQFAFLLMPTTN